MENKQLIFIMVVIVLGVLLVLYLNKNNEYYTAASGSGAKCSGDSDCPSGEACVGGICKTECEKCMASYATCITQKGTAGLAECRKALCDCMTTAGTAGGCSQAEIDENCIPLPPPPTDTPDNCMPPGGNWGTPGGTQGSVLASPCCQPPNYGLYDSSYKTCLNYSEESDPDINACMDSCCTYCSSQTAAMDSSWAAMCQCGCSLCCYNSKEPHFDKYGTCVQYIQGEPATAKTDDSGDYIGFGPSGTQA